MNKDILFPPPLAYPQNSVFGLFCFMNFPILPLTFGFFFIFFFFLFHEFSDFTLTLRTQHPLHGLLSSCLCSSHPCLLSLPRSVSREGAFSIGGGMGDGDDTIMG